MESQGSGENRRTITYANYESYLNMKILLLNKESINDLYLEVGPVNLPFQMVLPPNLPTTYFICQH